MTEAEKRDFVRFIHQVQKEDIVLCEAVQRGLGAGFHDRGPLVLSRKKARRHFQRLVCRALAAPGA